MSKLESYIIIASYLSSNAILVMFYKDLLRSGSLETYSVAGLHIWTIFFSLWPYLDPMQSWLYTFFQMVIIYFITKNVRSRYALVFLNLLGLGLFFILIQEYYHLLRFFLRVIKTLSSGSGVLALLTIVLVISAIMLLKYKKSNIIFIYFIGLVIILLISLILLLNYEDYAINFSDKYSLLNDRQALWSIIESFFEHATPELKADVNEMLRSWYGPSNDRRLLIYTINMLVKQVDPASARNVEDMVEVISEINQYNAIAKARLFVYSVIKYMLLSYSCAIIAIHQLYNRKNRSN
jgi:hypothetical protein